MTAATNPHDLPDDRDDSEDWPPGCGCHCRYCWPLANGECPHCAYTPAPDPDQALARAVEELTRALLSGAIEAQIRGAVRDAYYHQTHQRCNDGGQTPPSKTAYPPWLTNNRRQGQ